MTTFGTDLLVGKTFDVVQRVEMHEPTVYEAVIFINKDGVTVMGYVPGCCERSSLVEIKGDLEDLIGYPVTQARSTTVDLQTTITVFTSKGRVTFIWQESETPTCGTSETGVFNPFLWQKLGE